MSHPIDYPFRLGILIAAASFLFLGAKPAEAQGGNPVCTDPSGAREPTRVEITLAKKGKANPKEVKAQFVQGSAPVRVQVDFLPFLDPPMNIGIGRCVSAEMGRLALRQAIVLNRGVEMLILQGVLPERFIGIGTTKVAELSWIRISPEELKGLMDPTLSTDAFQQAYRKLARMKEQKRPFGMDPVPYPPEEESTPPGLKK